MHDVFLSYSSRDAAVADRVRNALRNAGLTVWQDTERIRALDDIPEALSFALAATRLTVVLVSQNQLTSRVCQWEAIKSLALGDTSGQNRLVLVTLDDDALAYLPTSLKTRRAIRLDPSDQSIADAAAAIRGAVAALRAHPIHTGTANGSGLLVGLPGASGYRFVFRLGTMLAMHAQLAAPMRAADSGSLHAPSVAVLHGMGGTGKSSTALFYVEQFGSSYSRGTAWLRIGGDRIDNEVSGDSDRELIWRAAADGLWAWCRVVDPARCARLESSKAVPAEPEGRWAMLRDGLGDWLARSDTLLLVLDDVPAGLPLEELIPKDQRVAVIVTSRDAQGSGSGYATVPMDAFTPFESMLLLTRAVDRDGSVRLSGRDPWAGRRTDVAALADAVGHHPLAVDLIANGLLQGESLDGIRRDIEGHSGDFYDVAEDIVRLPARHKPSILATIAGSLRGAALEPTQRHDRMAAMRLLMLMPAGSRVPVAMLEGVLGHSPKRTYLYLQGRSLASFDGDEGVIWCHALTRDVSRYLWSTGEPPFDDVEAFEPELSRVVTRWLSGHMSRQGQADLRVGASDAIACLAVLDESGGEPGTEQRVQRCEAYLALAREAFRTGMTKLEDCHTALRWVAEAQAAVSPPDSDWLAMAWWSAQAMRGLIQRPMAHTSISPDLGPNERRAAVDSANTICENADHARGEIGERLLAAGDGPDPAWVREKLAASKYNLTGFKLEQAKLEAYSGSPDFSRIDRLLAEMAGLHQRVIELRTGVREVDWSHIAASQRGRGLAAYYRALILPASAASRQRLLREALLHVVASVETRRDLAESKDTHDEIDVGKALQVGLKASWAAMALDLGVGVARGHAEQQLRVAGREVEELDCSRRYLPGPVKAAVSEHQAYRDDLSNEFDCLVVCLNDNNPVDWAAWSAICARWLLVAVRSEMGGIDPQKVFQDFFGEVPSGEVHWLAQTDMPERPGR